MTKPLFIVFEGIDGCGKSTQLKMLCDKLASLKRKPLPTAEPTDTATGKMLRAALSGNDPRTAAEMAALFVLDRIHHNKGKGGIDEQLENGFDVISDRYYYSSLAYQGVGDAFDWVADMNLRCPDIRHPDGCIVLDMDPTVSMARIHAGRDAEALEIYETVEKQQKIRERFARTLAHVEATDTVITVNADGTPDEVADRVREAYNAIASRV